MSHIQFELNFRAAHNSFQTYNDSTLNQIQLSQIGQHLQNNNASSTINNNSTYLINDHVSILITKSKCVGIIKHKL